MADMELAAREDDYGDGIEQERGWEERLLTEGSCWSFTRSSETGDGEKAR